MTTSGYSSTFNMFAPNNGASSSMFKPFSQTSTSATPSNIASSFASFLNPQPSAATTQSVTFAPPPPTTTLPPETSEPTSQTTTTQSVDAAKNVSIHHVQTCTCHSSNMKHDMSTQTVSTFNASSQTDIGYHDIEFLLQSYKNHVQIIENFQRGL
jgi:hypothetical protein